VLGRNTAGAGVPEEVTASQLFDWVSSSRTACCSRARRHVGRGRERHDRQRRPRGRGERVAGDARRGEGEDRSAATSPAARCRRGSIRTDAASSAIAHRPHAPAIGCRAPNAAGAPDNMGIAPPTATGTLTARAIAATSLATSMRRVAVVSAAGAGSVAGLRSRRAVLSRRCGRQRHARRLLHRAALHGVRCGARRLRQHVRRAAGGDRRADRRRARDADEHPRRGLHERRHAAAALRRRRRCAGSHRARRKLPGQHDHHRRLRARPLLPAERRRRPLPRDAPQHRPHRERHDLGGREPAELDDVPHRPALARTAARRPRSASISSRCTSTPRSRSRGRVRRGRLRRGRLRYRAVAAGRVPKRRSTAAARSRTRRSTS
jgi:hypothetical protein